MEQGPLQPKKRPKLLPLLYLDRERFNSFEGSFIISFVRWLMTSHHPLELGRSHYRAALHSWCVQAITAMPTLLDKVCEESRTSIEVVHLLLEMTTFLEELPSRTTPALVLPTETTMRITCVAAPPMATDPLLLLMGRMVMTLCHHESCSNPTASSCAMPKISSAGLPWLFSWQSFATCVVRKWTWMDLCLLVGSLYRPSWRSKAPA